MEPLPGHECRVAVVGSGMAGLATAYLLNRDPEHRYKVEVFEIVRATPNLSPDTE
jgi:2-polyprenyl-6-methoxyphenol hydroxylase-like FAD-dependent oxidoreductase